MSETKSCTCIKPLVIEGRRLSIGDPIELLESQARPLQHGVFITLDTAGGDLIRELVREEDEAEVDIDLWYDKYDNWVKMQFLKDGSTIDYVLNNYNDV